MAQKNRISKLVGLFRDDMGCPIVLTPGQAEIFETILTRSPSRNIIITPTQYGKSLTCSLALITRAITMREKWCIVGATEKKSRIIMGYVIDHIFDTPLYYMQLDTDTSLERLKQEKSKNRLTFRKGGEIFILSAQARTKKTVIDSLTGFGSPNVILDDSVLIDDDLYAMVKRMLGSSMDNFLLETGNPFRRNHFLKTFEDSTVNKIVINWQQAVSENRFTSSFIDEMRKQAFFDVLYECKFPADNIVDDEGYQDMFSYEEIESGIQLGKIPNDQELIDELRSIRWRKNSAGKIQIEPKENLRARGINSPDTADALSMTFYHANTGNRKILGVDVSGGGDKNVYILRSNGTARILRTDKISNTMTTTGNIITTINDEGLSYNDIFLDKSGLGLGIYDRLREQGVNVIGVMGQSTADYSGDFSNKRAEMYWRLHSWLTITPVKDEKRQMDYRDRQSMSDYQTARRAY